MNRRGILRALVAAPVAAPAAAKAAVAESLSLAGAGDSAECPSPPNQLQDIHSWQVIEEMFRRHHAECGGVEDMHHSISSKRSWSAAFKAHCHASDSLERQAIQSALHSDEVLLRKVAALMGVKS